MIGSTAVLLRGAALRFLAVALVLVGLVAMHSLAQAAVTDQREPLDATMMSTGSGPMEHADPAIATVPALALAVAVAPGSTVAASEPCHHGVGAGTVMECSSLVMVSTVAQAAVAAPLTWSLLPAGAAAPWPSPRTAAPAPPAPASTHVILRT